MIGLDVELFPNMCKVELSFLLKKIQKINANNLVAKAKASVSPYFGVQDFAFSYVRS